MNFVANQIYLINENEQMGVNLYSTTSTKNVFLVACMRIAYTRHPKVCALCDIVLSSQCTANPVIKLDRTLELELFAFVLYLHSLHSHRLFQKSIKIFRHWFRLNFHPGRQSVRSIFGATKIFFWCNAIETLAEDANERNPTKIELKQITNKMACILCFNRRTTNRLNCVLNYYCRKLIDRSLFIEYFRNELKLVWNAKNKKNRTTNSR